jgi:hypothetical protein
MNARYYVPSLGRFASADTIVPDPTNPQQFNRFSYTRNNPINNIDPSGRCDTSHSDYNDCFSLKGDLEQIYGVTITGGWFLSELMLIKQSFERIVASFSSEGFTSGDALDLFLIVSSGTTLNRVREHNSEGRALVLPGQYHIDFYNGTFEDTNEINGVTSYIARGTNQVLGTVVHEIGHIWDKKSARSVSGGLQEVTGGHYQHQFLFWGWGGYTVNDLSPFPHTGAGGTYNPPNHREDWSYTFQAFIMNYSDLVSLNGPNDVRVPYVSSQIQALRP